MHILYTTIVLFCFLAFPMLGQDIPVQFPRIIVNSDSPDIDSLLPDSTDMRATVSGVIADITIRQFFQYKGSTILDGALLMPAHPSITIHGATVKIGNQIISSEMKDKEKVRDMYEKAKKKLDPFFLNWQQPDALQMHLSNLQPGSLITIEIHYTQILKPTLGEYTLTLPKPLKPYYLKVLDYVPLYRDTFSDSSFAEVEDYPSGKLTASIIIVKGGELSGIKSETFVIRNTEQDAICAYSNALAEQAKELKVQFTYSSSTPQANLMMYNEPKEKFFLLALHPPSVDQALDTTQAHEYIVLCDSSALETGAATAFWKSFSKGLSIKDKVNILHFGNENIQLSDSSLPCTESLISRASVFFNRVQETDGLEPAQLIDRLQQILSQPHAADIRTRTVIVLTNGFVDAGADVFDYIGKQLDDANIFAVATGELSNDRFFDAVSRLTMSEHFTIKGSASTMTMQADRFVRFVQKPSLTQLKVGFDGFNATALEPASYPDLFSERPVLIFGKFTGNPKGRIVISGMLGDKPFVKTIDVASIKPSKNNSGLPYLWAKQRIALLIDYNVYDRTSERVAEITKLGMRYGIQTPYTSFGISGTDISKKKNVFAVMYQPLNLSVGGTLVASSSGMQLARTSEVEVEAACNYQDAGAHDEEGLISIGSVMTEKVLDNTIVESFKLNVEQQLSGMLACYAEALPKFFHLQGTVQLLVVFDEEGNVTEVSLADSELNIPEVEQCLIQAAQKISYPKTIEGMTQIAFLLEVL